MLDRICRLMLFRLFGWRIVGEPPKDVPKYIFVVLPHTSNWDFVVGWLAIRALDLQVKIFVKDVFFVWPLIYLCRFVGAAPVNRRESTNFVDAIAKQFDESDRLAALITPEGTRKKVPALKSGYYHLAKKGKAKVVVVGLDYSDKSINILPPRQPFDSFDEDQAQVLKFCSTMNGRNPERTFDKTQN